MDAINMIKHSSRDPLIDNGHVHLIRIEQSSGHKWIMYSARDMSYVEPMLVSLIKTKSHFILSTWESLLISFKSHLFFVLQPMTNLTLKELTRIAHLITTFVYHIHVEAPNPAKSIILKYIYKTITFIRSQFNLISLRLQKIAVKEHNSKLRRETI